MRQRHKRIKSLQFVFLIFFLYFCRTKILLQKKEHRVKQRPRFLHERAVVLSNKKKKTIMEATYLDYIVRLTLALVLGGAIGIEREYRAKEAGFRTHFLVALGSALFCVVSQFGFGIDLKDSSRVAAQVVSGIGFLGAGTIIFQKNVVRGLTTAAGLWVTAAIGLACGTGMFVAATIATVMVLLGLEVINALIPQLGMSTVELSFSAPSTESVRELIARMRHDGMDVQSYELQERRTSKGEFLEVNIQLKVKRGTTDNLRVIDYMDQFTDVRISAVEG